MPLKPGDYGNQRVVRTWVPPVSKRPPEPPPSKKASK